MTKTILIVEDDPRNLTLFRDVLQVSGYKTIEATDGKQGIESARKEKPDLILMDIQIPEIDGMEATRMLKADAVTSSIPVIALTSYAMKGDKERFLAVGMNDYISKPIKIDEFSTIIQKYGSSRPPEGPQT